jgi:CHAD domain-containing protein
MAYRLELEETVEDGFGRCALEQLDRAIQELTEGVRANPVESVHEARKALKMERSLLRLGRAGLKPAMRKQANADLRHAARQLSGTRDADVMLHALDDLAQRYAGQVPQATFAAIQAALADDRERVRASQDGSGAIGAAVAELRAIRARSGDWQLRRGGWDAVGPGLRRGYQRGQKAFALARRRPTTENLHSWRKRAKDLWYHLRLLEAAAPLTLGGQVQEAHALSDLLGDDHDLAVLRETVSSVGGGIAADLGPVLALIDHRREQLQHQARYVGQRLYAEKPKAFERRLRRYWEASTREAREAKLSSPAELAKATHGAVA